MNEVELLSEVTYQFSRSSGPGGQNVNKIDSKVILRFKLLESKALSEVEKSRIMKKLSSRLTKSGELVLSSQSARSQLANKKKVTTRFVELLKESLIIEKKRKKSKPSKGAVEKRLKEKKVLKEKKERRRFKD